MRMKSIPLAHTHLFIHSQPWNFKNHNLTTKSHKFDRSCTPLLLPLKWILWHLLPRSIQAWMTFLWTQSTKHKHRDKTRERLIQLQSSIHSVPLTTSHAMTGCLSVRPSVCIRIVFILVTTKRLSKNEAEGTNNKYFHAPYKYRTHGWHF